MTRKDYVRLAEALRSVETEPWSEAEEVWQRCVNAVADALAEDNPSFDRGRFHAAVAR